MYCVFLEEPVLEACEVVETSSDWMTVNCSFKENTRHINLEFRYTNRRIISLIRYFLIVKSYSKSCTFERRLPRLLIFKSSPRKKEAICNAIFVANLQRSRKLFDYVYKV